MDERNWLYKINPKEDFLEIQKQMRGKTMSNGANKKGAGELAAALAKSVGDNEEEVVSDVVPIEETVDTLALVKELQEKIKQLESLQISAVPIPVPAPEPIKSEDGRILTRLYDIVADHVTGASPNTEEQNISVLKGRVTSADLEMAQVDIAWLLKTGAIVDAGLDYV